jgi:hypothetical protein
VKDIAERTQEARCGRASVAVAAKNFFPLLICFLGHRQYFNLPEAEKVIQVGDARWKRC